jgi:hypothetical protein
MLCDRCVLGGSCQSFVPGGECAVESKAYESVVSELTGQYGLDGSADKILVERVAMYLIRITRAEVYEANVGVSDASVAWGKYISDLDGGLRALLRDLALTRAERKKLEKRDMLVDVDRVIDGLAAKSVSRRIRVRRISPVSRLVRDWTVERRRLGSSAKGDQGGREREKDT